MNKLLQSFLKINNKNLLFYKLSNKAKLINYRQINHLNEDSFGIGSKYAELDSVKSNRKFIKKSHAISEEDDPDTFGTLSNELDDIEFNSVNSYTKLPSEHKPEDEKIEKKYDKILNHIRLSNEDRDNTEEYYGNKINRLANEGKIKEAIDVFFIDMIEKDRFKPTLWLYKTLMKHLTELGYTHMVFTLFKKLTSSNEDDWMRSMSKLQKIITLLFYACSKSPWPEYSIKKCDSIRIYLKNRQITPNRQNYCAMILAYGKAGAIYEAFNVVDEMIENKILPDQEIINNLLCACISQPSYGFRYALITWQMALKFKIKPDLIMFNLILKAASECNLNEQKKSNYFKNLINNKKKENFGNDNKNFFPESSEEYKTFSDEVYETMTDSKSNINQNSQLIKDEISKINNQTLERFENSKNLIEKSQNNVINLTPEDVHVIDEISIAGKSLENQIKNLEWWQDIKTNIDKTSLMEGLTKFRPNLRDIILTQSYESLLTKINENIEKEIFEFFSTEQDTPEGRLSLLGGVEGFFKSMNFYKVEPDFKTFNIIVQKLLPNTLNDEIDLIDRMNHYKIKPDINFINFLIKRRAFRKDLRQADLPFEMLQEYQISPNILTFGCLAYQVDSVDLLEKFLNDLTNMNFKLNPVIIGILFYKGYWAKNIGYMKYLFNYIIENDVKIDDKLKNKIEQKINEMMMYIVEKERKGNLEEKEELYYNKTRRFYNSLTKLHKDWIRKVKIESKKHPYEKFARENDELYENFIRNTQKYEISDKYKHSNN